MAAGVEVVNHHFNYVIIAQYLCVRGMTIDDRVRGVLSDA